MGKMAIPRLPLRWTSNDRCTVPTLAMAAGSHSDTHLKKPARSLRSLTPWQFRSQEGCERRSQAAAGDTCHGRHQGAGIPSWQHRERQGTQARAQCGPAQRMGKQLRVCCWAWRAQSPSSWKAVPGRPPGGRGSGPNAAPQRAGRGRGARPAARRAPPTAGEVVRRAKAR